MSKLSPWHTAHRVAMWGIRLLPLPLGRLGFRAYHKLLRTRRWSYLGRSYFGATFDCDLHDLIQRMIFYFGVWEPDISRVIEDTLRPGDVFVDAGANIGYDALLAAGRVGAHGRVVAIEASTRTFALLQRNLALNAADNVRAVKAAVADRAGTLELYEQDAGNIGAATTLASRGGTRLETVDALPLTSILTTDEIARLRLLKMDIEGAEPAILRAIIADVSRFSPDMEIIVEASPQDDASWQQVFEEMKANGFAAYEIANSYEIGWYLGWRRPAPLRKIDTMTRGQQDLLFSRRKRAT